MRFNTEFALRSSYEAGPDGSVQHGTLVRMALEVGYLVTEALGMSQRWFETQGFIFVVYAFKVEFVGNTRVDERMRVETWLSQAKRFRGCREVMFTSAEDGHAIANVQLDWVYVDRHTLAPARMPPEILDRLPLDALEAYQGSGLAVGNPTGTTHTWQHRVQHREIDMLNHVNTSIYIEWCEQAWCEATGQTPAQIRGHHCTFSKSARYGDAIEILTQPTDTGLWQQTIRNSTTGEALVTNVLSGKMF